MQREYIRVFVPQDALSQHQVHAVIPRSGGGGVQDKTLVVQRHGTPTLNATEMKEMLEARRNFGQFLKLISAHLWKEGIIYLSDIS